MVATCDIVYFSVLVLPSLLFALFPLFQYILHDSRLSADLRVCIIFIRRLSRIAARHHVPTSSITLYSCPLSNLGACLYYNLRLSASLLSASDFRARHAIGIRRDSPANTRRGAKVAADTMKERKRRGPRESTKRGRFPTPGSPGAERLALEIGNTNCPRVE